MSQLFDYVKMAFQNIWANKVRSALTMLGIVIGISAVIVVLTVGGGGQRTITEEFDSISKGEVIFMLSENALKSDMITEADILSVKENFPEIKAFSPTVSAAGTLFGTKKEVSASITSGMPDWTLLTTETIVDGRMWNEDDYDTARNVLVLDERGAKELFGSADVVGMQIELRIGNRSSLYTIVGITKATAMSMYNAKVTASVFMPLTTLSTNAADIPTTFSGLSLLGKNKDDSMELARKAVDILETRHGNAGQEAYSIIDMAQFMEQINRVTGMFTGIMAAVAGISLLVGGIGVMNIMLVSVTERTREIGVRKALGARTRAILLQFLIEAGSITFLGGVIGVVLGILGGNAVSKLLSITGYISPWTILGVVLFSSVIGLFFGIYPAKKAAKLNPIEALRAE